MSLVDWGDVPTWIGGAGALAAGWYAYQTITSQRQQLDEQRQFIGEQSRFMAEQQQNLQLERAELRAAADDRKWAQARQVAMHKLRIGPDSEGYAWVVTVQNPTDAALHQVDIRFGSNLANVAMEWPVFDHDPSESSPARIAVGDVLTTPVPLLGAHRALRFSSHRWPQFEANANRPTLFFTDDGGLRWSLDSYGKLEEAPTSG